MRSLRTLWSVLIIALVAFCAASCGSPTPAPYCGDGACNNGENSYGCPLDCGPPANHCGDGRCDYGENRNTCPQDCGGSPGGYCGDGACGAGESASNCPSDCGAGPGGGYCGDHLPIASGGVRLSVAEQFQACPEWCWAATITMVANYYGVGATECGLASSKAGFGQPLCCQYGACNYPACDQPAPPDQMDTILGSWLGIHGYQVNGSITKTQLETELSNGRPVIVGYLNSFAGHVVLVDGFSPGGATFHVADPYYGAFDVTYEQVAYGYMGGGASWSWAFTWEHLSPAANGCNLGFDPACACK